MNQLELEQMIAAGKYPESAFNPDRRAGRKHPHLTPEDWHPRSAEEFLQGGMKRIERAAGHRAHAAAVRAERERWLPRLEKWLPGCEGLERYALAREIRRLKLVLGIAPIADAARRQARVRKRICKPATD